MSAGANQVWFQTDDAWDFLVHAGGGSLTAINVREEAKALRFVTSHQRVEAFAAAHAAQMRPFTLFGSGDFHHLSAVWLRQFTEPFNLLSFDNHPDWDIRPPHWSCGAWINRALENHLVREVSIWGCGNFECNLPGRLLGNRRAAQAGRLAVHPWRQKEKRYPDWLYPMTSETWTVRFIQWVQRHAGERLYVTVDMDCLVDSEAGTNWENGLFTCDDLVWALETLREKMEIIGGDLCGAWSEPEYATRFQKLAGWFDHPKVTLLNHEERNARHQKVLARIWPLLSGQG